MENQLFSTEDKQKLEVTSSIQANLKEIAQWARFLAIFGFVGVGFMVLSGLFFLFASVTPAFFAIIYLIMAVIYFFPLKYLYDFAKNMSNSLRNTNKITFADAFESLKAAL